MSTEKDNREMEELSMEEILGELESAITDLESGELTLDQSFTRYQQGMELVKEASSRIETAAPSPSGIPSMARYFRSSDAA